MGGTVRYRRCLRGLIPLTIAVTALTVTTSAAGAATTRPEYVAQADPICKSGVDQELVAFSQQQAAIKQARKRARRLTKKHPKRRPGLQRKLRRRITRIEAVAFAQFIAIERAVDAELATLTPAPPDESLIKVWLRARNELLDIYGRTLLESPSTGEGDLEDFFALIGLLYETNDIVRDFGFQYCAYPTSSVLVIGDG